MTRLSPTVLPDVDHLVQSSQLGRPVAQQDRVRGPQVELFSTQTEKFPHVLRNQVVCSIYIKRTFLEIYFNILNLNSKMEFDGLDEEKVLLKPENF